MSKIKILVGLACILSLLATVNISCQQGKKYGKLYFKEYQAKNADEAAIINVLIQYQAAFGSHDIQKIVSLFDKNGTYMGSTFMMRYPIASQRGQDVVKDDFHAFGGFGNWYDPVITVSGDKAVVKVLVETKSFLSDNTFTLVRKGKDWLVSDTGYTNIRSKGD